MKPWGWCGWVLVAASGIFFFSVPVADNDLWGHVYFGREMLASLRLPVLNQYSYTAPSHPWINHEILAECSFAATYRVFGSAGLLALKVALGLLALAVMAKTARRRTDDPAATVVALVFAASLMSYGYLVRPQIFSFLALAVVWDRLDGYAHGGDDPPRLWVLPLVFAAWINTHGGVLAGIAVLLAFGALHGWARPAGRRASELAIVAAACVGALLLNPYGWRLPAFLVADVLRSREISEWAPVPLLGLANLRFKAAVGLCALGALWSRSRDLPGLAVLGLAALATFRHERHLPMFAVLAAPHLAATFTLLSETLRLRLREISRGAAAVLAAGLVAIAALEVEAAWRLCRDLRFQIYVSPEQFPVEAVRFLKRAGSSGNLAVAFDWGEYAIWHLYPACRVSIDGRYTTAYPPDVIDRAWRFSDGRPGGEEMLADAAIALVERRGGAARMLAEHAGWRQVHADPTAVVFVRATEPFEPAAAPEPTVAAPIFP